MHFSFSAVVLLYYLNLVVHKIRKLIPLYDIMGMCVCSHMQFPVFIEFVAHVLQWFKLVMHMMFQNMSSFSFAPNSAI